MESGIVLKMFASELAGKVVIGMRLVRDLYNNLRGKREKHGRR